MCSKTGVIFGAKNLAKEVEGKRVIEVGSFDVNGTLRPIVESWRPSEYLGVDILSGPNVDVICNGEELVEKFGKESFDIVISTELLEHVRDWRKVISNLKRICKPGGILLITTRSYGFGYHSYPHDFWRYELDDMREIFSDCEILSLENDPTGPGVFVKIKKPKKFVEKDLSSYNLYSIVTNRKVNEILDKDLNNLSFRLLILKTKIISFILNLGSFFYRAVK